MQDIEFKKEYIQRLPAGSDSESLIHRLAAPLIANGCVVDDFASHVLAREKTFPTGLPTRPVGVAIPHTDHRHVHRNAFALGILPEPVVFADMGGEPEPVAVRIIFLLALGESNKQLNVLGWIMEMIQDGDYLQSLLTMDEKTIYQSISEKMNERGEL
ncbi:PTS suar transporter subunit IIA [Izhakiella australiensis]|uniref:PTS suar transporter subunit IIA n=1 Tax=Izhakiella australiensis TaxID=1926881 RepID=A0A1S8YDH1_9GAMM|nr:PTS sugar transporter subunit IIA [Izhakiella australiensis]OON37015.1 PTS suar transporter subunit IIA [Izhakiella australiensis]